MGCDIRSGRKTDGTLWRIHVKGVEVSMLPTVLVWAKAKVHALVVYGGSGSVAPPILNIGTSWK